MKANIYTDLRKIRDTQINEVRFDHIKLNHFHDSLMKKVIDIALQQTTHVYGLPPSPFTFFVMGSAGRFEQSIWSDQDNGIIFSNSSTTAQDYFLKLGEEISKGLFQIGYPYCDGGVMADHPLWCKSFSEWQQQLTEWISSSTWESIRHLLIFIDARALYGELQPVADLKQLVYQTINDRHQFQRIWDNTLHVKKGLNSFGQFLVEEHGEYAGLLNLKEKALFPYINASRLLAFIKTLDDSSSLSRLNILEDTHYADNFQKLLELRLFYGDHTTYKSGHYLAVDLLSKEDHKQLKEIIKHSTKLYKIVRTLLNHL